MNITIAKGIAGGWYVELNYDGDVYEYDVDTLAEVDEVLKANDVWF